VPRSLIFVAVLALAAGAAAAHLDPAASGPFAVGVTTRTFVDTARSRTLVTEIWYPARATGRDTRARRGRYPLVLFAHGDCGSRTNYEYLSGPLASRGFLVAAPDFPGFNKTDCDHHVPKGDIVGDPPRDLGFLRAAFHDRGSAAGEFVRRVRGRRAGLVGHSLGGLAVVNASVADRDMTAVVALAPAAGGVQGMALAGVTPRRAVLAVAGSADTTIRGDLFTTPFFAALAPPAFLVRIVGGTHSGFTDVDGHLVPAALARQQTLTRRYATAFLERYLARDRRFRDLLTSEDAATQGTDVELTPHSR
jgi:predicted dienelactone hydrolase